MFFLVQLSVIMICTNVCAKRFQPHFKFMRNEKELDKQKFIEDFLKLPLDLIYTACLHVVANSTFISKLQTIEISYMI